MSRVPFYKVKIAPKNKKPVFKSSFLKNRKGQQLFLSILGVYLVAGTLLGGVLFFNNKNSDVASASQPATVTSSVRFLKTDKLSINEDVQIFLTLQNSSVSKSVNDLNIEFLSTAESISWTGLTNNQNSSSVISPLKNNTFNLNAILPGQRMEYTLSGRLNNDNLETVTILGKLNYSNELGSQKAETNRIFTNLKVSNKFSYKPLQLTAEKEVYTATDKINLKLESGLEGVALDSTLEGKVYLANRDSQENIATFDCLPKDTGTCDIEVKNLTAGNYSAIFKANSGDIYSQIAWFTVNGKNQEAKLVPSDQVGFEFPFGNQSYNGLVPVIAKRVITQNKSPDVSAPCVFAIFKNDKELTTVNSSVASDRSCRVDLTSSQLNQGDGVYKVKLLNSNLEKEFSFVNKTEGLLALNLLTPLSQKGQSVDVKVENIVDASNVAVVQDDATLYIYRASDGVLQSTTNLNAQKLQIVNGVFQATIPGSYFQGGGNYLVFVNFNSGKKTDFLVLNLSDKNFGLSSSGVVVSDYSKLKVGESSTFTVAGITNKDNSLVSEGECIANFYTTINSSTAVSVSGSVKNGLCSVVLPKDKLTKSGPFLVTFEGGNNNNSIDQTRQLYLYSGAPAKYGDLNFEYTPVRKNYANSLILGPVVDSYNNLTTSFGNKLIVQNDKQEKVFGLDDVKIVDGFAKISIPSSIVTGQKITVKIQNSNSEDLIQKEVEITASKDNNLYLPTYPNSVSNDEQIKAVYQTLDEGVTSCKAKITKNSDSVIEQEFEFKNKECDISWDLNQFRDVSNVLFQIQAGNKTFSHILNFTSSEAANIFSIHPSVKFGETKDLEVNLLTSPIVDKYGLPVKSGDIVWKYNGKIYEGKVSDGFATAPILATNLDSKDIKSVFDQRFLDLDLDVKSGLTSFNQNNNLNIYLANFDISRQSSSFGILQGSNYITLGSKKIFEFKTKTCSALNISNKFTTKLLKTQSVGNTCYVEVQGGELGKNEIVFESNGYNLGKFDYLVGQESQDIAWCKNDDKKCTLMQVLAPLNSKIEGIVYDDQNQYKFSGGNLENTIKIEQNGLNPLKDYLVELNYLDSNNQKVQAYKTILGSRLAK